ncbi:MAG: GH3 auxin-responsive promoter family protein [Deltaproteobacteria bacterium]
MKGVGLLPDDAIRAGARLLFSGSWRRFVEATQDPRAAQTSRLLALVHRAKDTAIGREHDFGSIRTVEDFQRAVPVRTYDDFEPYLLRMVEGESNVLIPDEPFFFGRSSGTTGTPKYIPITPVYVAEYRLPRRVWARQVVQAFPGLVRGRILTMHSPRVEGTTPKGTPYGSVTVGLTTKPGAVEQALTGNPLDATPRAAFAIDDFDLKYYAILRFAAQERVSLAAAINPSTLVLFAKKLDEDAEALAKDLHDGTMRGLDTLPDATKKPLATALRKRPDAARRLEASKTKHGYVVATDVWPELCGLCCWKGGSAPFYTPQLERYYPGREALDYGFLATEGGFSIPLSPQSKGGVVSVLGHFLEFVPEAGGDPVLADGLELGQRYRVLITGSHGLYRYDINDVVECVGHFENTAEVAFVHKGGNMLSITGEKIGERHVVDAAARAEAETGVAVAGFTVACRLTEPPRYVFAVEPRAPIDEGAARGYLAAFEAALSDVNMEYAAKRSSQRLGAPELWVVEVGAYDRERRRRVSDGAPDSHVKPPHLAKDVGFVESLGVVARYGADR